MTFEPTINSALTALGFYDGWAANEAQGVILWTRSEPQPTEAELIAAGWVKPKTPAEETPTE